MRIRLAKLLAIAALAASPLTSFAQNSTLSLSPEPAATLPPLESDIDASYARPADGPLGLRPSTRPRSDIMLPWGMSYSRESRTLMMSLDDKNESGIGLQLNLNRMREVELAPSGLGLQPKRTPGIIYNKRF